jgi:hypothetical protein
MLAALLKTISSKTLKNQPTFSAPEPRLLGNFCGDLGSRDEKVSGFFITPCLRGMFRS